MPVSIALSGVDRSVPRFITAICLALALVLAPPAVPGMAQVYRGLSVEVGRCIPFPDNNFDIVVQYTVFSSVLDDNFRKQLASEMLRVSKPEGLIISYDFWPNNPHNKDVRGVTQSDIRRLFPGCRYHVQRIILAPPISRRVAPISSVACEILERIPVLRSHFLIGITAGNS